jgi:PilZ domain
VAALREGQRSMTQHDKRRQSRYRLVHQPTGPVVVIHNDERQQSTAVNDVSSSGISLCLPTALPVRAPVAIEFQSDGLTLDVNGLIAWCRPHRPSDEEGSEQSFVLGIELFSPMLLLSAFRDALPHDAETFEDA